VDSLDDEYDYVVVGSGAGEGPVAANLAKAGFRVLIIEAGGDNEPPEYQVPAFHALAAEHRDMAWKFTFSIIPTKRGSGATRKIS
jgi:choline dehydrogenase